MTKGMARVALAALAMGCGPSPRTEILVGMATDFSALDEIDSVTLRVEKGGVTVFEQSWDLADERLPGSVGFVPGGDASEPFTVIAEAFQGAAPRVERRSTLSFVDGETLFVRLGLVRNCETMGCPTGQTCIEAQCRREEIDSTTLPLFHENIETEIQCNSGTVFVSTGGGQETAPLPSESECDATERCMEGSCYRPARGCRDFCAEIADVAGDCYGGKVDAGEVEAQCLLDCNCLAAGCTADELEAADACLGGLSCETWKQTGNCLDAIPCVAEGAVVCEGGAKGYCGDYLCDAGEEETCPSDCAGSPTECPFGTDGGATYCNRYNQYEYYADGGVECAPGEQIQIACPDCVEDPILQVWDGESCFDADDDSCGNLCPTVTFTCPASGYAAVWVGPYSEGDPDWSCNWTVLSGG